MNVYVVTVSAVSPLGSILPYSFNYKVTFMDPCQASVLTIAAGIITPSPYTYILEQVAAVRTLADSYVSGSETVAVCPTTFEFTVI